MADDAQPFYVRRALAEPRTAAAGSRRRARLDCAQRLFDGVFNTLLTVVSAADPRRGWSGRR